MPATLIPPPFQPTSVDRGTKVIKLCAPFPSPVSFLLSTYRCTLGMLWLLTSCVSGQKCWYERCVLPLTALREVSNFERFIQPVCTELINRQTRTCSQASVNVREEEG